MACHNPVFSIQMKEKALIEEIPKKNKIFNFIIVEIGKDRLKVRRERGGEDKRWEGIKGVEKEEFHTSTTRKTSNLLVRSRCFSFSKHWKDCVKPRSSQKKMHEKKRSEKKGLIG